MWALIVDVAVREITDIDPAGRFHPSLVWVECGAEVEQGWGYDGSIFTPPTAPAPLPVTRIERRQGLRALLSQGVNRAMIEGMISAIEDPIEREIALAEYEHTHWMIESPFIAVGAAHFGMSEEQVQALFEHAATL